MPALRSRPTLVGLLTVTLAVPTVKGHTNPYDDCILEHMATAQNKTAANAIERACISKASIPITRTFDAADLDARAWAGKIRTGFGEGYGLLVRIKNSTPFNITELVVTVQDQKTNKTNEYVINNFDEPVDGIYAEAPEPAYRNIIPVGTTRSFFVPASEVMQETAGDFFKQFNLNLRLSKGILSEVPTR